MAENVDFLSNDVTIQQFRKQFECVFFMAVYFGSCDRVAVDKEIE